MGFNAHATLVGTKVTVLVADPNTPAPDYSTVDPFNPTGGWSTLGHLSDSKHVKTGKTGGDISRKGSAWIPGLRNIKSPTYFNVTLTALQFDKATFDAAFNGVNNAAAFEYVISAGADLAQHALYVYVHDSEEGAFGLYLAAADLSVGAMPEFALTEMSEIEIVASALDDTTGATIKVYKDSFGAPAALVDASATASLTAGSVSSVSVTGGGTGYVAPSVSFTGGGGTGATAHAVVNGGVITSIVVDTAGTGYTSAPTVKITR